ncbi:hypothetical protein H5410_022427 [Solanum commersonii]|uniref:Uncharacterized protein n=1 Tax=Solanum commersonii TaxID=4109 RepID=A0A9J5ZER6_SOLCO|nr:hypothetical protein H5410_022427 [Solanum commersonii]
MSCGQSNGKWSTEGWEEVRSVSWGQPKEDGGPPDSPWSKGKWSTKGKDKMKPGEELLLLNGWENQTQKVGPKESTTLSMHPKAKWSKMQTRGLGGS